MKISVKQYAVSLYQLIEGKSESEVKKILKNFVILLNKNLDLNKANEIITAFAENWSLAHGELAAELISARELGPSAKEAVTDYLKEKSGAKKISLNEIENKEILGGFILKYDNRIIDGSLRNTLEELKTKIKA